MLVNAATIIVLGALVFFLYTYLLYPLSLWVLARFRRVDLSPGDVPEPWPVVSITVPAYNEAMQARGLCESLLAIDYPKDRLQILIVSDGSTDGTEEIVRKYADRGIDLLAMPERGGKTKAENAAADRLHGDLIVNTDASIRIRPEALKRLVRVFQDPRVGLASGRDISVGTADHEGNLGESGYVGYEMKIRDLETDVGGIIGASGCFYAIRPALHRMPLPESLSRDFAAALHTIENGFMAVSVPDAVCEVPRTTSIASEYKRKVRTITRGMETLWHKRALLNPFRYGLSAWMLLSHKICRWLLPWAALAAFVALGTLAPESTVAAVLFGAGSLMVLLAAVGWLMRDRESMTRLISIPTFVLAGNVAAAHALLRALSGDRDPTWEPTRR